MHFQVYKIHSDFYYVKNSNDEYVCKLRDILKKQKTDIAVGDYVKLSEDKKFVVSLVQRKNFLLRPKTANIDLAIVMVSFKQPELDFVQLNRYLTYLKFYNINSAICVNKEDLENDLKTAKQKIKNIYEKLGYKLFFICAKNNLNLSDLKKYIKNKNIILMGQSGVGKSTLTNALIPNFNARTNCVSLKSQKGCHTTRHSEIVEYNDFKITDTPGFSCLKFDFILPHVLIDYFDDLKIYKNDCKYSNCLHNNPDDTDCNIIKNLNKIEKTRYDSYLNFLDETFEYKKTISKRSLKKELLKKDTGDKIITKISKRKRQQARNTINQQIEVTDE